MLEVGIFAQLQFVLDFGNAPYKKKSYIKKLISSNGGQISYLLSPRCDFMIVFNSSQTTHLDTCKSRKAISLGIPIVSEQFIEQSIADGKLLDKDEFIVVGDTPLKKFSKGIISTPNKRERKQLSRHFSVEKLNCYKLDSGGCDDFGNIFQVAKFAILVENDKAGKGHFKSEIVEIHAHQLQHKTEFRVALYTMNGVVQNKSKGEVYLVQNSWEAIQCFKALVEKIQQKGMRRVYGLPSGVNVGSPMLRKLLNEMKSSAGHLHPQVVRLVDTAWKDSLGELENIISVSPQDITIDQVRNATIVLIKLQNALKKGESVSKYSNEFYECLPHKENRPIDSIAYVSKKQELCQLLRDIMLAGETAWLSKSSNSTLSQYMALNCSLVWLDPREVEYKMVANMMSTTEVKTTIRNIFQVSRSSEHANFRDDLPNMRILFHGSSPANYVGIFSRGLLLPNVVTGQLGYARSDEGNFGSGIYFSDSLSTSLQYAFPSPNRGSRLVLLNKVALGEVFETHEKMPGITRPPVGYDSIKGALPSETINEKVNKLEASSSEFIVYSANQQKMAYLVELTLDNEEVFHHPSTELMIDIEEHRADERVNEVDLNPSIKSVETGLISKGKPDSAKLEEVHVRAKVIDMVAEVVIFQAYTNESGHELEAKYVFPLSEDAAVCGFEAFINDKHVVGIVKEKEQAHREYKQAVKEGHGAYLMDQEEPSIFTVSVGNIPPFARVLIKLTYVSELKIAGGCEGCILFSLPGNISPWKEASTQLSSSLTQTTTESVAVSNKGKSSLLISVDMPFNIIDLNSPTHKIVTKQTLSKACVKLSETCCLGEDFTLLVKVAEIHVPRMWVERNGDDGEDQVSMVAFYPEFDIEEVIDFDCLLILDMSNSMHGTPCHQTKALVSALVNDLPDKCSFNIVVFGSNFEEAFLDFKKATDVNKSTAKEFISASSPTRGGSDLLFILQSAKSLYCNPDKLRNIFLFSDGQLSEEDGLKSVAHKIFIESKSQTRIFTFGIGKGVNSHILQKLSQSTGGAYEYFDPGMKRTWKAQLKTQLIKASQPVLTSVWIEWSDLSSHQAGKDDRMEHAHAPENLTCLFNGSQIIAYSFKPRCTQATLHADICGKEFSTVVTAPSSAFTAGQILHRLAAKAILKEYEKGVIGESMHAEHLEREIRKDSMIELSVKHSIMSRYTSFVAIEKREEGEQETLGVKTGPTVSELVNASFVDILPEIQWAGADISLEHTIDNLLKRAHQTESSSIMEARRSIEEAKKAYCLLPSDDPERKLLISAAACRLGVMESESVAWKDLKSVFLNANNKINQEFLYLLCKESAKTELNDGVLDLASKIWPNYFTVQISSYKSNLRPIIIAAFCKSYMSDPEFLRNEYAHRRFWGWVNTLDGTDNRQETYVKNVLSMQQLQVSHREIHHFARLAHRFDGTSAISNRMPLVVADDTPPSALHVNASKNRPMRKPKKGAPVLGGASVPTFGNIAFESHPLKETFFLKSISGGSSAFGGFNFGIHPPQTSQYPHNISDATEAVYKSYVEVADSHDLPPKGPPLFLAAGGFAMQAPPRRQKAAPTAPMSHRAPSASALFLASSSRALSPPTRLFGGGIVPPLSESPPLRARGTFTQGPPLTSSQVPALKRGVRSVVRRMALTARMTTFDNKVPPSPTKDLLNCGPPLLQSGPPAPPEERHRSFHVRPPLVPGRADSLSDLIPTTIMSDGSPPPHPTPLACSDQTPTPPVRGGRDTFLSSRLISKCGGGPLKAPSPTFCLASAAPKPMMKKKVCLDDESSSADEGNAMFSTSGDTSLCYDFCNLSNESLDISNSFESSGSFSSDDFVDLDNQEYPVLENGNVQGAGTFDISFDKSTAMALMLALDKSIFGDWIKQSSLTELQDLLECSMESEGCWCFPDVKELSSSMKSILEAGKDVIIEAGGTSFGHKALNDILDIFLSAVVIIILKCIQFISHSEALQLMITKASKWLRQRDNKYPSLYRRLELGTNWDDAALKVTYKALDKLAPA